MSYFKLEFMKNIAPIVKLFKPLCVEVVQIKHSLLLSIYCDKIYKCMMSTQELVGIHNNSAHKSWWKYATDIKVGKVN